MLYYIVKFLACLLAVYGAFTLISCMIGAVRSRSLSGTSKVRIILVVRDVEEQIENIVRNAFKFELTTSLLSDGNVTFVDMDSKDGTLLLLNKLKKDYENMDILEIKEKDRIFVDFEGLDPKMSLNM